MSDKLIFYTHPMSRGRIARWMLEEVGVPYETKTVEYGTTMKGPEYLAINPMGKVPTLIHGKKVITECAAICAYLADVFPETNLAPPPNQRAEYYRWMFFTSGPLEYAVTNNYLGWNVGDDPEKQGMLGYGNYETTLDTFESALKANKYIVGDQFTAADVYVGSHLRWGLEFGTIKSRPVFEEYKARISDRPALTRANEIDDALLAKLKEAS